MDKTLLGCAVHEQRTFTYKVVGSKLESIMTSFSCICSINTQL